MKRTNRQKSNTASLHLHEGPGAVTVTETDRAMAVAKALGREERGVVPGAQSFSFAKES